MHRRRAPFLIACLGAALLAHAAAHAQRYGFGLSKRVVTLQRRLLPEVQLGDISLAVVFPRGPNGLDTAAFTSELETLVSQNRSTIRLVARDPQYEIQCYATNVQRPHITAKTENKITTRSASGEVTMDARLVHASDGAVILAFTESAVLSASSTANSNGNVLTSTIKIPPINFPGLHKAQPLADSPAISTEPLADTDTDASLNARLLRSLALHVASHMTPMNESIPVLLAGGGALDEADKFGQNSRWTEYLEALEGATPAGTPAEDAYRLYNIGVANEALGYAASSPQAALKYLRNASIQYSRAAEDKPDEKYFVPPQKRIEVAIVRYTGLLEREKGSSANPGAPAGAAPGTKSERFTNADVIKLVQAGVPKEVIVTKINSTADVVFDLSTDGIIELSKGGVPPDLINVMTRRMHPEQTAPAPVRRPR